MTLMRIPNRSSENQGLFPIVNSVFDNFFNDSFLSDKLVSRVPAVNIAENDESYTIEMAAPGLEKNDFQINVDKEGLTISAEKEIEKNVAENKFYNKKEYSYNSFSRSFSLPDAVDHSKIDAIYENGVLKLTIGKKEESIISKRLIEVR
ncbi:MAG TPA: Hsp20/alpha crystallin family protein [Candidatus Sphingobacterium stercoripullorum]|uniref:Hsp20/alpha crystallin family protein n=1 Tax=Candidatus Sphingobacterium stercoripullorum TaxID=2838759 RepID=A0A9D1W7J8_9SPHI|nr:Hsp20/alpha crystallin family protein [Candidatus Sphingobacterium stercoripullorum]HLR48982.1 Hsp20/alpha crystallin family protein [Candidatus Sphingobacterium stercoripullorum]